MAQAVAHLSLAVGRFVSRAKVWLVQAPEDVQQFLWEVVAVAAVSTIEDRRQFMVAAQKGVPTVTPGPAARVCRVGTSLDRVGFGGRSPSILAAGAGHAPGWTCWLSRLAFQWLLR